MYVSGNKGFVGVWDLRDPPKLPIRPSEGTDVCFYGGVVRSHTTRTKEDPSSSSIPKLSSIEQTATQDTQNLGRTFLWITVTECTTVRVSSRSCLRTSYLDFTYVTRSLIEPSTASTCNRKDWSSLKSKHPFLSVANFYLPSNVSLQTFLSVWEKTCLRGRQCKRVRKQSLSAYRSQTVQRPAPKNRSHRGLSLSSSE